MRIVNLLVKHIDCIRLTSCLLPSKPICLNVMSIDLARGQCSILSFFFFFPSYSTFHWNLYPLLCGTNKRDRLESLAHWAERSQFTFHHF